MMTARKKNAERLCDRLPAVRGSYTQSAPLGRLTWFRVGGNAEVLFEPQDREDLAVFLKGKPADVPVTLLGLGSNLSICSSRSLGAGGHEPSRRCRCAGSCDRHGQS